MTEIIDIEHLSIESKEIWTRLNKEFMLEFHHRVILRTSLEAFDRMIEARQEISKNGAFYKAGKLIKKNPALDIEKEAFNRFLSGWKMIGFNLEIPKELGRPPGS